MQSKQLMARVASLAEALQVPQKSPANIKRALRKAKEPCEQQKSPANSKSALIKSPAHAGLVLQDKDAQSASLSALHKAVAQLQQTIHELEPELVPAQSTALQRGSGDPYTSLKALENACERLSLQVRQKSPLYPVKRVM